MHSILKLKAAALFNGGDWLDGGVDERESDGSGMPITAERGRGKAEEGEMKQEGGIAEEGGGKMEGRGRMTEEGGSIEEERGGKTDGRVGIVDEREEGICLFKIAFILLKFKKICRST